MATRLTRNTVLGNTVLSGMVGVAISIVFIGLVQIVFFAGRIGVLLVTMAIAACSMQTKPVSDFCLLSKPILVSRLDVFTPETARAILDYNERGAALCGWKAASSTRSKK